MTSIREEAIHEVGWFRFEVFGSGRRNRYTSSKFDIRCDAIGVHEREILLLSVIGPETSVKALTAGLRSSGKDQKRIEYSASVVGVNGPCLSKCPDGYRVYRAKLDYDQWHVLFLAKRKGFMPVMTDEALWQHLQGEEFTTPLLREWIPRLKTAMQRRELLACLDQSGCQGGIVLAQNADLDEVVSQGLKKGDLTIGGEHGRVRARREGCGSPLWQMNGQIRRYEPALFIKRRLRNFFKYLVLDEVHEEKGSDTAQGHAAGALASCCQKLIALTGTVIGGYAEHLRPLLFRLAPRSLVNEGLGWSNVTAFNERYGRIETRITEKSGMLGEDNRMSRGSKSTTKSVRPGIMPILFGKHLIDKSVFLGLSEVADNLPALEEECIPVRMDAEQSRAYRHDLEEPLTNAIKDMIRKGDRRLLGAMLQSLLAYPDYPFDWEPIGYWQEGWFVTVATPPSLSESTIRPKEALIDLLWAEKLKGRKVWVYVQFTDKHDVQGRLEKLIQEAGMEVSVLRSSVALAQREEWIAEAAPNLDVVISHPRLVETGLDLFDKNGGFNFPTICFYETGYNLFTLRQASRRSWRIGQSETCRIVYLHYEATMQERAMALMGKKLTAAQALGGSFSSEGLVAMAGEDANVEIALARSLVERMDEGDARRHWSKTLNRREEMPASSSSTLRRLWDDMAKPKPAIPAPSGSSRRRVRAVAQIAGMLF